MNIGILISAIGVTTTLIGIMAKLSINMGRYMEKLSNLDKMVKDHHDDAEKNFKELYDFKSSAQQTLASINVTLQNINMATTEIKADLKELKAK